MNLAWRNIVEVFILSMRGLVLTNKNFLNSFEFQITVDNRTSKRNFWNDFAFFKWQKTFTVQNLRTAFTCQQQQQRRRQQQQQQQQQQHWSKIFRRIFQWLNIFCQPREKAKHETRELFQEFCIVSTPQKSWNAPFPSIANLTKKCRFRPVSGFSPAGWSHIWCQRWWGDVHKGKEIKPLLITFTNYIWRGMKSKIWEMPPKNFTYQKIGVLIASIFDINKWLL